MGKPINRHVTYAMQVPTQHTAGVQPSDSVWLLCDVQSRNISGCGFLLCVGIVLQRNGKVTVSPADVVTQRGIRGNPISPSVARCSRPGRSAPHRPGGRAAAARDNRLLCGSAAANVWRRVVRGPDLGISFWQRECSICLEIIKHAAREVVPSKQRFHSLRIGVRREE